MTVNLSDYKNIIYDLGGVIINIDPQATVMKFKELGIDNIEYVYSTIHHDPFVLDFEKGMISPADFRDKIRRLVNLSIPDDKIDIAWSAMLLDIPKERIDLLKELKEKHRVFILSNTNAIHIDHFNNYLNRAHGIEDLEMLFDKCYYSSDIGYRKPDPAAFKYVLDDAGLIPGETLFIDDFMENIETAKGLGLEVLYISDDVGLLDIV